MLEALLKKYCYRDKKEFFREMTNCLELCFEINESNYKDHVEQFERYYPSWIQYYEEE